MLSRVAAAAWLLVLVVVAVLVLVVWVWVWVWDITAAGRLGICCTRAGSRGNSGAWVKVRVRVRAVRAWV